MSQAVFVDASAWIALADADDQYHSEARGVYLNLLKQRRQLLTTNLVIGEAYVAIRRTLGHSQAITFLESLRASPRITKVYADAPLEDEAERILRKYTDQDFSYVDAVSFALMRQRRLTEAFAFDKHFATAGFTRVPGQPLG